MKLKINEDQPNIKNEVYDKAKANAEYIAKIKRGLAALERGEGILYNPEDDANE